MISTVVISTKVRLERARQEWLNVPSSDSERDDAYGEHFLGIAVRSGLGLP